LSVFRCIIPVVFYLQLNRGSLSQNTTILCCYFYHASSSEGTQHVYIPSSTE